MKNDYRLYQLASFFVMKFSYKITAVPNQKADEIWLINSNHEFYPTIRLTTNSIEQVMFEKERIDMTIKLINQRFQTKGRYLDMHIGNDEVLEKEEYDTVVLDSNTYHGIDLSDIYPGIKRVVHDVSNPDLEIQEILKEMQNSIRQAKTQKRRIKQDKPILTYIIIGICLIFYLLEMLLGAKYGDTTAYILLGANYKMFTVGLSEFWRLLTAGFLHGSIFHLFMNMMSLYYLGSIFEKELGKLKFALILFIGVISGSLTSLMFEGNILSVGLSAGLYALMTYYLVTAYKNGYLNSGATMRLIMLNLLINFMPGVDVFGHLGGLIGGLIMYYIYNYDYKLSLLALVLLAILSYKVYSVDMIDPKYGGSDAKVVEAIKDMGFEGMADSISERLFEVYTNR